MSTPTGRDRLLDTLRALATLKVIALHTSYRLGDEYSVPFSFVMPGMPIVFFVSGAVSARMLDPERGRDRRAFLASRFRRLAWPFWAYALPVLAFLVTMAAWTRDPGYGVDPARAVAFVVPLWNPEGCLSFRGLWGHLWFMPVFVWLIALAPFTVAAARRWLVLPALLFLAAFLAVEFGGVRRGVLVAAEVRHVLGFGALFCLGHVHAARDLARLPRVGLAALCALTVVAGILVFRSEHAAHTLHQSIPTHVFIGLAWLFALLAARGPLLRLFEARPLDRLRDALNRRAYTLFLWAPAANWAAFEIVERVVAPRLRIHAYVALSLVLILITARAVGWVEDRAARRGHGAPGIAER